MSTPTRYVAPIHFEDFSGEAFERVVFAYHLRAEWWQDLEWYGQVGSDSNEKLRTARVAHTCTSRPVLVTEWMFFARKFSIK